MQLGDPLDPALRSASLALNQKAVEPSSRFASIELRGSQAELSKFAPLGYLLSAGLALALVLSLWFI